MKALRGILGLLILAGVAAAFYWVTRGDGAQTSVSSSGGDATVITGWVGGEKSRFLANPEIQRIFRKRYDLVFDATKAGSIEMVTTLPTDGKNVLWPSNQVATELHRRRGGTVVAEDTVFNSPIVLYTWDVVADAFLTDGLIEERGGSLWVTDFAGLVDRVFVGTDWSEVGLSQLYGRMKILSTDPRRSNSGNMFAGLLANMRAHRQGLGEVITEETLPQVLPELVSYFERMGYMEHSSGDIFENFLKTGVGAKPIIVGYENQLIEYAIEHEEHRELLSKRIRTLYPVPTVWSSHPVLALDSAGKRLTEALHDDDVQLLAWEQHGFRSGLLGVENDPAALPVQGIPASIDAVVPMPSASVMERILEALGS